ncbi:MAG: hypothetical protein IT221_09605 [Fluviicola sp.]|jgi:hypothetical protein|nr:hypothetical protein [Fluviicola sp.]
MKKIYLKLFAHIILITKNDSQMPMHYQIIPIIILSFHNLLNLLTVSRIIVLNSNFFENSLPKLIYDFFDTYKYWMVLVISICLILNNVFLYKKAKETPVIYEPYKTGIYTFSYMAVSWALFFVTMADM